MRYLSPAIQMSASTTSALTTMPTASTAFRSVLGLLTVPPTAATVSATLTAAAITAATATTGALFARTGNIDVESAAPEFLAVHAFNRLLCFLWRAHGDEGKPAGPASCPVSDEVGFHHGAVRCESVLQVVLGDFEVEIPDEQFGAHSLLRYCPGQVPRSPQCSRGSGLKSSLDQVHLRISMLWK